MMQGPAIDMSRDVHRTRPVRTVAILLLSGAVLWGCGLSRDKVANTAQMPSTPPAHMSGAASISSLADTQWRLVEFQSMDDAVGIQRTDDPTRYTLRLHSDGRATLRLNCNFAQGRWSAEASQDPSSGRFTFTPLAATRALCPPPSLDEQVVAQAGYIRSYLLKDGRLYLSLLADGGIYVWEPHAEEPFETKPDPALEAAILRASPNYTQAVVDVQGGTGRGRYVYGRVDLNNDGRDEVFVYLLGSIFCGTGGCNLLLFTHTQAGYSLLNAFSTTRLPVIVVPEKTLGWNNIVWLKSGGGVEPSYLSHTFDGKRYVEGQRRPADQIPPGVGHLAGELTFDMGIPLEPRD